MPVQCSERISSNEHYIVQQKRTLLDKYVKQTKKHRYSPKHSYLLHVSEDRKYIHIPMPMMKYNNKQMVFR